MVIVMKRKVLFLLGVLLLTIIIVMNFVPRHLSEEKYMKYLDKYNQDFVMKSKVEDFSQIQLWQFNLPKSTFADIWDAYVFELTNNPDVEFIVCYGKFRYGALPFKNKEIHDSYRIEVQEYLQKKYSGTIVINDELTVTDAVTQIEDIIKQKQAEYETFGLGSATSYTVDLKFDIKYYDKLIEDVHVWNDYNVYSIIMNAIE